MKKTAGNWLLALVGALKKTPNEVEPGDIWSVRSKDGSTNSDRSVLILEVESENVDGKGVIFCKVATIHQNIGKSGMLDVIFEQHLLGKNLKIAVVLGSAFSMLSTSLNEFQGTVTDMRLRLIRKYMDMIEGKTDDMPNIPGLPLVIGAPFIDDEDPAAIFHDELTEATYPFQAEVHETLGVWQ